MMTLRRISLFVSILLLLAGAGLAGAAEPAGAAAPQGAKKLRIAVIPKGTTHEFWKSVHAGANQAAKELGVEVIWKGPMKEDDREQQIKVVEDFTNLGVAGIVVAPLDDTALLPPIQGAMRANIPVVIFDSALKGVAGADYVSFVATDNFKGGQMAGEYLAKSMKGQGNAIMMRYQEGSASTAERERGFLDAMGKAPGIKLVSDNQYGGATTESAQQMGENLLARFKTPDGAPNFQGLFCPNESTTFGMLRALQDARVAGKVKYVGFDSSDKLIAGLQAGEIDGLVLQNPMKMGYLAVKTLVERLQKKPVPPRIDTGAVLVTRENMAQPEIQQLLKPDLKKWLGE